MAKGNYKEAAEDGVHAFIGGATSWYGFSALRSDTTTLFYWNKPSGDGTSMIKYSPAIRPTYGKGFEDKGYSPLPGERTVSGYLNQLKKEESLLTSSPKFNNVIDGAVPFKRIGKGTHGGIYPHVHYPSRNINPKTGNIYGEPYKGSNVEPNKIWYPTNKDIKQLYEFFNNRKYGGPNGKK